MTKQSRVRPQIAHGFPGTTAGLAERIGSAERLVAPGLAVLPRACLVTDRASLGRFLREYQSQILIPLELPAICRAHGHAARYEIRELIELDRQLANEPLLQDFATASQRVGKTQLKRLRPLRDQRLVQRYLGAVQAGQAHAWHTLVYGVILWLYSLPLRQGLLSYAHQSTRGFVDSVACRLAFSEADCRSLTEELNAALPAAVNAVLHGTAEPKPLPG